MEYRVDISLNALQDAEDAYFWIKYHSPAAAGEWYEGLLKTINSLENFPHRCPLSPESRELGLEIRQLLYGRGRNIYRILFSTGQDEITKETVVRIHHIRHASRRSFRADEIEPRRSDES